MNIARWLSGARGLGVARLDAQQLLAHHIGRPRTWLLAHDDQALADEVRARADADLAKRAAGVPLAYLLGEREFHGLVLQVTPDVLVPRPETEGLVDWAIEVASGVPPLPSLPSAPHSRLADLGTGSGAIALALKRALPALEVHASDRSAAALAVAEANGRRLGLQVGWLEGDWWQAHVGQRYGLAVSNPPYVAEGDAHLEALRHEPRQALTAGPDGLADLRHLIAGAPDHLLPGGWLLVEHGFDQAEVVRKLLAQAGFEARATRLDLAGLPRCSGGRLPLG